MKTTYPAVPVETLKLLHDYAANQGLHWKADLLWLWETGRKPIFADCRDATALYTLRNTHGPSWLRRFSLAKFKDLTETK